jgi:hypothetical protein
MSNFVHLSSGSLMYHPVHTLRAYDVCCMRYSSCANKMYVTVLSAVFLGTS